MTIRTCGCITMLAMAACGPANEKARVRITYEQVANFADYRIAPDSNDSHAASPDGIFILYRIKKIDNSGSQAKDFTFKTHDVVIVTDSKSTNEETSADNIMLGAQLASPINVPAGTVKSKPKGLGCIIKVARSNTPTKLVGKMIDPIHTIDPDQPVSMTRAPGNTSEAAVSNALPATLQNLCNTL
ncbi:MAG: hypothetical protein HOV81_35970 [Kofleriaceae bacterium]|nr:hypothetical protein [Kofleriaceae bacterium]